MQLRHPALSIVGQAGVVQMGVADEHVKIEIHRVLWRRTGGGILADGRIVHTMDTTAGRDASGADPIMGRLEDQIAWYDRKSMASQRAFKRIKFVVIASAALIPFLTAITSQFRWVTGGLGLL